MKKTKNNLRGSLKDVMFKVRDDSIFWKCTAEGEYSTHSAYQIQFKGSMRDTRLIWKPHTHGKKCKIFAWTLI